MKLQSKLTKFIKKWLNLPRCLTQAAIYDPDVLQLPFLPQIREQAKISMVTALEFSSDPYVKELLCLLKDPGFLNPFLTIGVFVINPNLIKKFCVGGALNIYITFPAL